MKFKSFLLAAVVLATAGFSSCKKGADLNTEMDSISYALGVLNSQGVNTHLANNLGLDSTKYLDSFLDGIAKGMKKQNLSDKEKAYEEGVKIGQQIVTQNQSFTSFFFGTDSTKLVSEDAFIAAFIAAAKGDTATLKISKTEAEAILKALQTAKMQNEYSSVKKEGEDFLVANKTKDGVITTESGLQYKIITAGNGEKPSATDSVEVHYKGTLINGTVFDSSYERKAPSTFVASAVIKGWSEALQLMPVGSKWELYIPQELAYGAQGAGQQIPPFSTLIFEVELLKIKK